ncbi:MAG: ion channel [Coleofasciculaceae cyanobacterium]
MQIWGVILGSLILILLTVDVLVTTLTLGGGGLVTGRLSSWLWWVALQVHKWRSNHRFLTITGWTILVGVALLWYTSCWLGWTILFSSYETAVVNASSKQPASLWEIIYFTGYTLSTLGMGDYQPQGAFWQLATAIASTNGFFLVTLTFAYLLPVVSSATAKRQLAVYITSLGGTADDIVTRAWNGKDFGQFDQHLISLAPMLSQLGESHLTYPVLHYFHSVDRTKAIALSLVTLDDALTLLEYGVKESHRPDPAALGTVRRASAAFLITLKSAYLEPASDNPPLPSLEPLRVLGIPTVSDQEFWEATKNITRRRRLLLAFVENDGWVWDTIASSKTSNRGSVLDDETSIADAVLH